MSPSRSSWREILRRQRSSGLSASAFCRRAGVPVSSFYAWRRKLASEAPQADSPCSFVEMRVLPAPPPRVHPAGPTDGPSGVELRLPGGGGVALARGFDRQTLLDLLQVLQAGQRPEDGA